MMIIIFVLNLIYALLIAAIYHSKQKVENTDNKLYKVILNSTLLIAIIDVIQYVMILGTIPELIIQITNKIYMVYMIVWITTFTNYVINKSKEDAIKKNKKLTKIIFYIVSTIVFLLPVEIFHKGNIIYTYGESVEFVSLFVIIQITIMITCMLMDIFKYKTKERHKYIPLLIFVILGFIVTILQTIHKELLLTSSMFTFITLLTYFFIENPDVKMLEEVSMAKETAEKANSAKTEFLSNMSHEIRTPLNAIVGFSESLKDDNVPEETKGKINDIITASNNLLEIVNGILDISKIEANKLELVNKEYDIKSTLDELESLTRARIGEKGLELNVNIDPTLPRVLYGDKVRLKQVILNILTNAVKYTKEGHIDFTVSSVVKDDICRLIVSVEDTGIGIKQENIKKLFSKFERLDVEKQMTIEGTGLGLAITKKLVDLMGGTIVAQSVYGQGSKFTVSIDQKIISVKPIEKPKPALESKIIDVSGAKALIVDDNELNIKVASTLLKKYNFTIDSCTNGQDCIKKLLEDDSYDIIFLDDMMPRMSGREVIKKLKQAEGFNIPTIALTANAIEGMKEEYLACGFDDYLSKPIEKVELERVIKTYLNKMVNDSVNSTPTEGIQSALSLSIEVPEETKKKKLRYTNCTGMNFLLVDDSEIELKVTGNLLEKNNCKITKVRSGSECIVKVIDKPFDLILMDDQMPNLNGVETIENIEQIDGFKTPIILLTNAKDKDLQDKLSKSKNIIGYLRKPVDKYELNELLKKVTKKGDK
ncbi:MAG: response regulator [Candidatus Coprovivens sp.]